MAIIESSAFDVFVYRGEKLESQHSAIAVLVAEQGLIRAWGDACRGVFTRSLIKPIQAKVSLDLIRSAGRDLRPEQIAIASSSHNAEPEQLALVDSLIADFKLDINQIACGYKFNCSGKHAAILAAVKSQHQKNSSADDLSKSTKASCYIDPDHSYHNALVTEFKRLGLNTELYSCSDGCGLPTYYMTITELALLFQAMIKDSAYAQILSAINSYPLIIGGKDQFDSLLMQNYPGKFLAKSGAEGMLMVANLITKQVLVLKLLDGAKRAKAFAIAELMKELGWIPDDYCVATHNLIRNAQGKPVAELRSA